MLEAEGSYTPTLKKKRGIEIRTPYLAALRVSKYIFILLVGFKHTNVGFLRNLPSALCLSL